MILANLPIQQLYSADSVDKWIQELSRKPPKKAISYVIKNANKWPDLDAPNPAKNQEDEQLKNEKEIATVIILVIEKTMSTISSETDKDVLLEALKEYTLISQITSQKSGYLNDLISETAKRAAIFSSWRLLSKSKNTYNEVKKIIISGGDELNPKKWFMVRVKNQQSLIPMKKKLETVSNEIGGLQIGIILADDRFRYLQSQPTVYQMIDEPDLIALWGYVLVNDFELSAVLPSAIDYIDGGGILLPAPKDKAEAIRKVFGKSGIPYKHGLREGSIYSGDIWRSLSMATEARKVQFLMKEWFGETQKPSSP